MEMSTLALVLSSIIGGMAAASLTYTVLNRRKSPHIEPHTDPALDLPYLSKQNVSYLRAHISISYEPIFTPAERRRMEYVQWLIQHGLLSEY